MTHIPTFAAEERVFDALLIPICGVLQAVALGIAVFATRDIFVSLHSDAAPQNLSFVVLGCAGILAAGLEAVSRIRAEALGQSYAISLRNRLYMHLSRLPRSSITKKRLGGLALRFVGDLSAARNWFGRGLPRIVSAVIVLPSAGFVFWLLEPQFLLPVVAPIGLSILVSIALIFRLETHHRNLRGRRARIAIDAIERLAMSPELDLMGRTRKERRSMKKNGRLLLENAVARAARVGLVRLTLQAGAALAALLILWTTAVNAIAPGFAAAGLSMIAILMIPLTDLADAWDKYCAWRIAREKLNRIFDLPQQTRKISGLGYAASIRICGAFDGHKLDISVPAGGIAAVTAGNGLDTSRLLAVIAGLDDEPDLDVQFQDRSTALPRIGYIGVEPVVLRGSLRRNLALGTTKRPDDATIDAAAHAFGLGPLMERIGGLDGRIEESGRNLRIGELNRLELARTALTQPDVVVVDSPRLSANTRSKGLVANLHRRLNATILIANRGDAPIEGALDVTPDNATYQRVIIPQGV